jgi:hypothetical protein
MATMSKLATAPSVSEAPGELRAAFKAILAWAMEDETAEDAPHAQDGWRIKLAADEFSLGPFATRELADRAAALAIGKMPDNLAYDKSSARVYDKDGRLHLESSHISKACVSPYLGNEIPNYKELGLDGARIYQLLRDPDELAKAAPTLNGVPLMIQHIATTAKDHKTNDVVGAMGTTAVFNAPFLDNGLTVWPQEAIDGVENESQRDLSAAYHYKPDMTPGTYEGAPYDGVMRDIVFNHVAIIPKGRVLGAMVGDSDIDDPAWSVIEKAMLSLYA